MNVLEHPDFLSGEANTSFIDANPHLFALPPSRNRAQKILHYLANTMVNGPSTPLVTPYPPSEIDVHPPETPFGQSGSGDRYPDRTFTIRPTPYLVFKAPIPTRTVRWFVGESCQGLQRLPLIFLKKTCDKGKVWSGCFLMRACFFLLLTLGPFHLFTYIDFLLSPSFISPFIVVGEPNPGEKELIVCPVPPFTYLSIYIVIYSIYSKQVLLVHM